MRKEKREARARLAATNINAAGQAQEKTKLVVATWNVQRMSLGSRRRWKLREVAEYARRSAWDVVLLSEVWAEEPGVMWLGQGEEAVVVVHSEKAAVLLRGEVMKRWSDAGMPK